MLRYCNEIIKSIALSFIPSNATYCLMLAILSQSDLLLLPAQDNACAIIILVNQNLNIPNLSGGWIILAKMMSFFFVLLQRLLLLLLICKASNEKSVAVVILLSAPWGNLVLNTLPH